MMFDAQTIKNLSYHEKKILGVCDGREGDTQSFMTHIMELEDYNQLEISMPKFLIGQQFDIIIIELKEDCDCDDCIYDKSRCEPIVDVCGTFVFQTMPHEFFNCFYKGGRK